MLLRDNLSKLSDSFPDYESFSIPAVKSNMNISRGRPSGGISLLWKKELNHVISRVTGLKSDRVQGIILILNGEKYLITNPRGGWSTGSQMDNRK